MKKGLKKTNNNVEKLQNKWIAKFRRIKNRDKLKKEDLIISHLKSENSNAEYLNNNTNDSNNTNDDTYDDTYDIKIRDKISDVRMILSRLGNTVTKKDKKKIKKELYEIEKKENLSDKEKGEIYDHLVNLVRALDKKKNIDIITVMI